MDNDDRQIGRVLSRREVLALFGAAGAAILVGCGPAAKSSTASTSAAAQASAGSASTAASLNAEAQTAGTLKSDPAAVGTQQAEVATAEAVNTTTIPACVVRPEVTEGPYYVDENLVRSDIREDRQGAPLVLAFNISQVSNGNCSPLQGATVEVWHCDAAGQYSDVSDRSFNTTGQKWLRGAQVTDANGVATFTTIYPGWYSGRAIHIHFKVHPNANQVLTSQLFFPDEFSDRVLTQQPYASKGRRDTLNSTDNIYQDLLLVTPMETANGYATSFPIGVDLATMGTGNSRGRGPGGPSPRGNS